MIDFDNRSATAQSTHQQAGSAAAGRGRGGARASSSSHEQLGLLPARSNGHDAAAPSPGSRKVPWLVGKPPIPRDLTARLGHVWAAPMADERGP